MEKDDLSGISIFSYEGKENTVEKPKDKENDKTKKRGYKRLSY